MADQVKKVPKAKETWPAATVLICSNLFEKRY